MIQLKNLRALGMVAILCAGLSLSACASGAAPEGMTLGSASRVSALAAGQPGYQALTVTTVTGGNKTNPLWTSKVSSEDFKTALEASLKAKGYLAADGSSARLRMTAELTGLKQPMAGLDMNVTSQVHYKVTDSASGKVLFDDLVAATGTATMSDALVGVTRLRMANEASIKGNIEAFITRLDPVLTAK